MRARDWWHYSGADARANGIAASDAPCAVEVRFRLSDLVLVCQSWDGRAEPSVLDRCVALGSGRYSAPIDVAREVLRALRESPAQRADHECARERRAVRSAAAALAKAVALAGGAQ